MDIALNWNEWHQETVRKPYVRVGVTLLSGALILMSAQEIVSLYLEKNLISDIAVCATTEDINVSGNDLPEKVTIEAIQTDVNQADVNQAAAVPAEILVEEPIVEEIAVEEPVVEEIVAEKPGVKRDTTINGASEPIITNPDSMENVKNETEEEEEPIEVGNINTGYLINAEGVIYGLSGSKEVIQDGVLLFPEEGCSQIAGGALSDLGSAVEEIEIPVNITNIQSGAFAGLSNLGWIEADAANPAYVTVDGVLYTADGTVLLAFPAAWTGTFQVPEGVKSFAESAFDGTNLECIDARSCTLEQTGSIPETVKLLQ
ncbi:hypothetical protein [Mediterraneibacter faecis]|jgi:hypothetical protein|uniref:hypothetical protein n=1 Tax=Mediterraneibacter faecis TaxID=592978 RepID=UPI000E3FF608|nr:hypothetical protein [Mediterraneibacter faecis]RGD82619.1 hypothetical protein DXD07_09270 [Ruminococcus sp. TF10-6]RGF30809.1 hypothetical protein DW106_01365 [Ruminococcus sp. AM09-18-1]RGF91499.1 hypothetical protein DXA12_03620 [Ruminococcus sp. AM57-5]RGG01730.1 hypothetical protein DWY85_09560 [Ruminococcus sp. AF27-3]RGG09030.1 hypothetical protein DWY75_09690 [Ruminococcus sp. AF27-11AA]RGG13259.1 hypothetical protein DWY78_01405 [Ruminococcus sp. AF27-12AA]RGG31607.1 hypothetica